MVQWGRGGGQKLQKLQTTENNLKGPDDGLEIVDSCRPKFSFLPDWMANWVLHFNSFFEMR